MLASTPNTAGLEGSTFLGSAMINQRRQFTDAEIADMIAMYKDTHSAIVVGKKYHYYVSGITRILKENGERIWQSRNFTDEEEDEIAKIYQAGYGVKRIARAYHLPHHISVSSSLERKGVAIRPNSIANRLYEINPDVFDILNEESAYWWGFLYADGYVHKRSLIVGLQGKDQSHLEKLAKFLGSTAPIKDKLDNTHKYSVCELFVTHSHLAERLTELGIVKHRTRPDIVQNLLPVNLYNHWIRGFFDGDGSAGFRNNSLHLSFCGSKEIMTWLQGILGPASGAKATPKKHTISSIYYIIINGNRVAHAASDFLYQNASVWMERKHDIVESAPRYIQRKRGKDGRYI